MVKPDRSPQYDKQKLAEMPKATGNIKHPQQCFQQAANLKGYYYIGNESAHKIIELEAILREYINQAGGIEVIDAWLAKYDINHQNLSSIRDMDWSFLD